MARSSQEIGAFMTQSPASGIKAPDPAPEDAAAAQGRSTRSDWLRLAVDTLIRHGIDRVKVQVMARQLKVSRSSFYWYFKTPEDLHTLMLDFWLEKNTGPIIQRAMAPCATINQSIFNVFSCWISPEYFDPHLDVAVRLWARRDPRVRGVVASADRQRLQALQDMFVRHGYAEPEALVRARVLYFTQIGQYTLEIEDDLELRLERAATFAQVYSGQPIDPADNAAFSARARRVNARG